jgi:hypothetical protein
MKKLWIVLFASLITTTAFAEVQTFEMTGEEIEAALALVNRIEAADIRTNADCSETEVVIQSRVTGFSPARWTATFIDAVSHGTDERYLEREEIAAAIALFDRVEVPLIKLNSVKSLQSARVKSRSCGMSPANWTISYDAE